MSASPTSSKTSPFLSSNLASELPSASRRVRAAVTVLAHDLRAGRWQAMHRRCDEICADDTQSREIRQAALALGQASKSADAQDAVVRLVDLAREVDRLAA